MPYIKPENRKAAAKQPGGAGELNFAITKIVHKFINNNGLSYSTLNTALGVLECAKLELYRMVAVPYEDIKIIQNGPISNLDRKKKSTSKLGRKKAHSTDCAFTLDRGGSPCNCGYAQAQKEKRKRAAEDIGGEKKLFQYLQGFSITPPHIFR